MQQLSLVVKYVHIFLETSIFGERREENFRIQGVGGEKRVMNMYISRHQHNFFQNSLAGASRLVNVSA